MKSEHNPAQIILYYTPPTLPPAPPFFLLQDVREWTSTLNQSPGHTMFQYQTFHMTLLTLSFYALLHPDSIKNGLTALFQDWGGGGWEAAFCCWALCSTLWLMGGPGGLLQVSLKVWDREEGGSVYGCALAADIWGFTIAYFPSRRSHDLCIFAKKKWVRFDVDN